MVIIPVDKACLPLSSFVTWVLFSSLLSKLSSSCELFEGGVLAFFLFSFLAFLANVCLLSVFRLVMSSWVTWRKLV